MGSISGIFTGILLSSAVWGAAPPPSFDLKEGRAVFVDFIQVNYRYVYDAKAETTRGTSDIIFENTERGMPIFDLVADPSLVQIDSETVQAPLTPAPDEATQFRVARKILAPGRHTLHVEHSLNLGVLYGSDGVRHGFFLDDLSDRGFLENYFPASFEHDAVSMTLHIELLNQASQPEIYTNGVLSLEGAFRWKIVFPNYFTSSSPFYHMTAAGAHKVERFDYLSSDGRSLPVTIYSAHPEMLPDFARVARDTLKELEADYGPFPHPQLVIYGTKNESGGGMEYCGATASDLFAVPHEITHSYFGRGFMPANGNAGWLDEALASWRDNEYLSVGSPDALTPTGMAAHSPYMRATDADAYTEGRDFMGYLETLFRAANIEHGLKAFLADFVSPAQARHRAITTDEFQHAAELRLGRSLQNEFDRFVRSPSNDLVAPPGQVPRNNPYHHKLERKRLMRLL